MQQIERSIQGGFNTASVENWTNCIQHVRTKERAD